MTTNSFGDWLAHASRQSSTPATPALEAQALLAHATGLERAFILAHPEQTLDDEQLTFLTRALKRLQSGEPLAYITGRREFYGLELAITPDVLVPRPETELLVEQAILWLRANPGRRRAADIGTGSGCIALALAHTLPDLSLSAGDRSPAALQLAAANSRRYGLQERIHFVHSDLLEHMPGPFDLLCANLPYIPTATLQDLAVAQHEPHLALDGGPDGLRLIARLLAQAPQRLAPAACILLEIEAGQGQSAPALARETFPQAGIHLHHDYAGHPRLLHIQLPSEA